MEYVHSKLQCGQCRHCILSAIWDVPTKHMISLMKPKISLLKLNISCIENDYVLVVQMMYMPIKKFDRVMH